MGKEVVGSDKMRETIDMIKKIILEGFDEEILDSEEMKGVMGGLNLLRMMTYKYELIIKNG